MFVDPSLRTCERTCVCIRACVRSATAAVVAAAVAAVVVAVVAATLVAVMARPARPGQGSRDAESRPKARGQTRPRNYLTSI